jgi:15-cis-phytoene desaturase
VLAGKLAAEVVAERAVGIVSELSEKEVQPSVYEKAKSAIAKDPVGVLGEGAIAFGVKTIL